MKEIQLPDRYAALAWICQNQLGRRNLDPERRKFLMGKAYENEKLSVGAPVGNQNKVNQCGQNVHIDLHKRTCERIAERNGVNSKFVQRAEKYAKGVDAAEATADPKESSLPGLPQGTERDARTGSGTEKRGAIFCGGKASTGERAGSIRTNCRELTARGRHPAIFFRWFNL